MSTLNASKYDDDIVVRRVSDSLSNTLLVVVAICIIGAIALQIWEIYLYRGSDRETITNAASDYAKKLKGVVEPSWTSFSTSFKEADGAAVVKGTLSSTGFEIADPNAFKGIDTKKVIQKLIDTYHYGINVYSPVLKTGGIKVNAGTSGLGTNEGAAADVNKADLNKLSIDTGSESSTTKVNPSANPFETKDDKSTGSEKTDLNKLDSLPK